MAKKILHAVSPISNILGITHKSKAAPVDPAVVDQNQTLIAPTVGQKPRRGLLTPLGQSQAGNTILSDTLG